VGPTPELAAAFEAFCSFGKGKKDQMEGKTWWGFVPLLNAVDT
jgi:hypothetical protein